MKEDNTHAKDFAALSGDLLRQMTDRGYNDFAIEVAGYDLKHIGEYLAGRGVTAYSPALGGGFLSEWPLSPSGRIRFESLIHKLDDICRDGEFKIAHCAPPAPVPEGLGQLLEAYLAHCSEKGNSQSTISRTDCACRGFLVRLAEGGCPRPEDIEGGAVYRAAVAGSRKSDWYRIRGMLGFLASEGILERDWSAYVPIERRALRLPSVYSKEEIESALAAVDRATATGRRDYAVMMLLTRYGMRVGDIVALAVASVDFGNDRIEIVQEKTGNPLSLPLLPEVASALDAYIRNRQAERRARQPVLAGEGAPRAADRAGRPPHHHEVPEARRRRHRGQEPRAPQHALVARDRDGQRGRWLPTGPQDARARRPGVHTALREARGGGPEAVRRRGAPAVGLVRPHARGSGGPAMSEYEFRSAAAGMLRQYREVCRSSYADRTCRSYLHALALLDGHLCRIGYEGGPITQEVVEDWLAVASEGMSGNTVSGYITAMRSFAAFLSSTGIACYAPPQRKASDRYTPYIYTDDEVSEIMRAADNLRVTAGCGLPYIRAELPVVLRILCGCGTRIGETLLLKVGDVDLEGGTITMRRTKGAKERLVPMHPSLTGTLAMYCAAMGLAGNPGAWLFPGKSRDVPIGQYEFRGHFLKVLRKAGVSDPGRGFRERGPCLHCFRHWFVLKSFKQLEAAGVGADDAEPYLSIYLGHARLNETESYMKFSAQMFPEELEKFEDAGEGLYPEIKEEDWL